MEWIILANLTTYYLIHFQVHFNESFHVILFSAESGFAGTLEGRDNLAKAISMAVFK